MNNFALHTKYDIYCGVFYVFEGKIMKLRTLENDNIHFSNFYSNKEILLGLGIISAYATPQSSDPDYHSKWESIIINFTHPMILQKIYQTQISQTNRSTWPSIYNQKRIVNITNAYFMAKLLCINRIHIQIPTRNIGVIKMPFQKVAFLFYLFISSFSFFFFVVFAEDLICRRRWQCSVSLLSIES